MARRCNSGAVAKDDSHRAGFARVCGTPFCVPLFTKHYTSQRSESFPQQPAGALLAHLNLTQSDVGRPVGHLVSNLVNYTGLVADVQNQNRCGVGGVDDRHRAAE
jgi:hypothetical protein